MNTDEIVQNLRSMGIAVRHDPTIPTAVAILHRSGYEIRYGNGFDVAPIFWHEFSHIVRGDCLADLKGCNPLLANYAMDAIINSRIDLETIKNATGVGGITLDGLRKDYPDIPQYPNGWRKLHDIMLKSGKHKCQKRIDELVQCDADVSPEEKRAIHAAMLAAAIRRGVLSLPMPNLPKAAPNLQLMNLQRLTRHVRLAVGREGRVKIRTRSWRRPGRVALTRGHTNLQKKHVEVLFDCSGSMADWVGMLLATQRSLARRYHTGTVIYDTEVRWEGRQAAPADIPVGGGTTVSPALRLADSKRPDCVVVITDGEHEQNIFLPGCPIVWALVPKGGTKLLSLRSIDRVVNLQCSEQNKA